MNQLYDYYTIGPFQGKWNFFFFFWFQGKNQLHLDHISKGKWFQGKWFHSIPGKVVVVVVVVVIVLIQGKNKLHLDHISKFLSHQFVTWYLKSISIRKIVKLFYPCMSEHMIYIKNITNVTQTLHQNVTNVTKQNIASKEMPTTEFHTNIYEIFICVAHHLCISQCKIP